MSKSVSLSMHKTPDTRVFGSDEFFFLCAVANEQGSYTTPSFVSFTDKERLIGEAAKNQAAMNPKNTIFDIK